MCVIFQRMAACGSEYGVISKLKKEYCCIVEKGSDKSSSGNLAF